MAKLFVGNDMSVTLTGLRNAQTQVFINDAIVVARVYDSTNTQVGSDITMSYQAASDGNYSGQIPSTLALTVGDTYRVEVSVSGGAGGLVANFSENFIAKRRTGFEDC